MGKVSHLFRAPQKRAPMEELQEAVALEDSGLAGCAHARPGKRQLLLVDRETLQVFDLQPGIVRENITTEGLDVNALAVGQSLRIGDVELHISMVCDPCEQIEALRPGLQVAMAGKRGMLCKVVRGGVLKRGAEIVVVGTAEAAEETRASRS